MKKILSVVLVLAMVLALGVTAFAANTATIEAGKTEGIKYEDAKITVKDGVLVSDKNGFLVVDTIVVNDGFVAFNLTAPAGTEGKLAKLVITDATKDKNVIAEVIVEITEPAKPVAPAPEGVLKLADVTLPTDVKAVIDMNGVNGIAADLYNALKSKNYESITFVGDGYTWTLTRGDYTKMNVTAPIYFGAKVDNALWTKNASGVVVRDTATENLVMKALGTTQADLFYVTIADNCNIGNVASKPALVVEVGANWINFNNKFSVTAYKFDGEAVAKVAEGLAVKPTTNKLTLNLTTAGTYVFVADNYTVNPTPSTSEKPNASTGANSAAAVVALAVMAVAAVASKKIVK